MKGLGRFSGLYQFTKPLVFVTDLDFLKIVLVKDFQYFHDRGSYHNEKDDVLSGHLFNVEGEYWKKLRSMLTPIFTSGRLRQVVPLMVEIGVRLEHCITEKLNANPEVEVHNIFSRFTTDIIGTTAFGIDCNSLEDPNCRFLEMGLKVFHMSTSFTKKCLKQFASSYPELGRKLGITFIQPVVTDFFLKTVKDIVEYREKNQIRRNDFMDLLLQLKRDGELSSEGWKSGKLNLGQITAQAFIFFLAVSST